MKDATDRELKEEVRQAIAHLGLSFYEALDHVARSNGMSQYQVESRIKTA